MPLRAAACLHLHPTHCSQMFDSLQRNIAGTATSTATIGGPVAVAFIAAAGSFLRRLTLGVSTPWLLPVGAMQLGAKAATNAAQTARQSGGHRWAAWPARRRVSAVVCGALLHAQWRTGAATATEKKCACESSFCGRFRMPERAQACELKA